MPAFKIRDNKTGLFSTGGANPGWSKRGKVWSTEGALKAHLTQYVHGYTYRKREVPETWEVVELVEIVSSVRSARALAERPAKK